MPQKCPSCQRFMAPRRGVVRVKGGSRGRSTKELRTLMYVCVCGRAVYPPKIRGER